jgi:voltage-gated potassium channel
LTGLDFGIPERGSEAMVSRSSPSYAVFMLVASVLSLVSLAFANSGRIDPESVVVLQVADFAVCLLFFADFLYSMATAKSRWRYFFTWGWLDLLSSIPMVDSFRLGRFARIFRVIRLIRGIRASKILVEFILKRRAESAFLAVSLISVLLIVTSAIAILQFETLPESNIKDASDALWWAITTITTVGYGDKFPLTPEGRLIASALMLCGVGLFGTLSGFVASAFLKPAEKGQSADLDTLLAEVRELKAAIAAQGIAR